MIKKRIVYFTVFLLCLESILSIIDPINVQKYREQSLIDVWNINQAKEISPWTWTVFPDETRLVPDTNPETDCTIVAIGDSYTFGHGVDDADTWVNILARNYPDVHFVNAGIGGGSIYQIKLAQLEWQDKSHGFIYYIRSNPEAILKSKQYVITWMGSYTGSYLWYGYNLIIKDQDPDLDYYYSGLETIFRDPEILSFTDNEDILLLIESNVPNSRISIIPYHNQVISTVDLHPNPDGHALIAEYLSEILESKIQEWCGG